MPAQIVVNIHICCKGYKKATRQRKIVLSSLPKEGVLFKAGDEKIRLCPGDLLTIDWAFKIQDTLSGE